MAQEQVWRSFTPPPLCRAALKPLTLVILDVANPGQYGLPYVDLELQADDGIKLRCYLLIQAKHLPQPDAAALPPGTIVDGMSDDEVGVPLMYPDY